ncbi:MAG: molybdopterin-dependent oxidoreductase [Deltaproteobacteria bacterium]|nr:molybdopterin-dependent oxidoreductase [Deltaproteobacteria bacterium]
MGRAQSGSDDGAKRVEEDRSSSEGICGASPDVARREAIKSLGLLGAGAVALPLAGCQALRKLPSQVREDGTGLAYRKPYVPGAERFGTGEEVKIRTSCGQCPAGCGLEVRVVEGRAVGIAGNPTHPLNRGTVGPRGIASLQALYDADRIAKPLRRNGNKLVPIEWNEAIDLLTSKLADLRKRAPHRLLVMSGRERGVMQDLLARFCRAYGTPNLVDGRPGRSATLAQATLATLGKFESPAVDWSRARYVLSLEAGLSEDSCQAIAFHRGAASLRRDHPGFRAKMVHVGPVFDLAAHNADEWIPAAPGSSLSLALAICHVLLRERLHDSQFVKEQCSGFDGAGFGTFVEPFSPESVSTTTGVPARTIERIAREMAAERPAVAIIDERSLGYSNGWETALAALGLNALLGGIGRSGGLWLAPSAPLAEWGPVELDETATIGLARPRLDGAGGADYPLATSIPELLPAAMADKDAGPEAVLVYQANPAWARPQPRRWREALAKIPFVVSFTPYLDETAEEVAHLVLPDHTFLERWEDAGAAPSPGRALVGVRRPVVDPFLDTRAAGDVILDVARRLGGAVARAFPWETFRDALDARLVGLHAASRGSVTGTSEREFLVRLFDQGFWEDSLEPSEAVTFRFFAEHAEPEWHGDKKAFPLLLLPYRPAGYAEGSGANQPWLRELRSRPGVPFWSTPASMHPDSAGGARDGDLVTLASAHGSITVPVRLDPLMWRGCVAVPMGGGHTALGRWAKGVGANVMELLDPTPAPHTGARLTCGTRVRIAPAKKGREA